MKISKSNTTGSKQGDYFTVEGVGLDWDGIDIIGEGETLEAALKEALQLTQSDLKVAKKKIDRLDKAVERIIDISNNRYL